MIALPNPTKIFYTGLSSENTMTKHPLTDEILWTLYANISGDLSQKFEARLARSAADWQLDQVIEWLKECPNYDLDFHSECRRMIADLKKAMRSQQQENN